MTQRQQPDAEPVQETPKKAGRRHGATAPGQGWEETPVANTGRHAARDFGACETGQGLQQPGRKGEPREEAAETIIGTMVLAGIMEAHAALVEIVEAVDDGEARVEAAHGAVIQRLRRGAGKDGMAADDIAICREAAQRLAAFLAGARK